MTEAGEHHLKNLPFGSNEFKKLCKFMDEERKFFVLSIKEQAKHEFPINWLLDNIEYIDYLDPVAHSKATVTLRKYYIDKILKDL